jgi:hypothetical protein
MQSNLGNTQYAQGYDFKAKNVTMAYYASHDLFGIYIYGLVCIYFEGCSCWQVTIVRLPNKVLLLQLFHAHFNLVCFTNNIMSLKRQFSNYINHLQVFNDITFTQLAKIKEKGLRLNEHPPSSPSLKNSYFTTLHFATNHKHPIISKQNQKVSSFKDCHLLTMLMSPQNTNHSKCWYAQPLSIQLW